MIKIDRYLKFSIVIVDSDVMGLIADIIGDIENLISPKETRFHDYVQGFCSPGPYVMIGRGNISYGMGKKE